MHPMQVTSSLQEVATFECLDNETWIHIARRIPLGSTNLNQLNHRARGLKLSAYQPMLHWVRFNVDNTERWVDALLPQPVDKMHIAPSVLQ